MNTGSSLRTEFLFNLAFLAAAALLLALAMARALQRSGLSVMIVALLIAASVLTFVLVGKYLLDKWILRPLTEIAASAEAIATGESEHRVSEDGPVEIASVARALNHLTEQLLQNQSRLAENIQSLDETNQQLLQTQRELVQAEKMASLGHLAAGVAHEIGNPLGAVMGYISVQKRRGGDPEIIEGLEREARRIDRIVRELLDYARPGSLVREPVEVNASIERVLRLLREQDWLKQVDVELTLESPLPPVMGDPHRIDQIFLNLLRNAESAMEGSGRILIDTRKEHYLPDKRVPVRRADDPPGVNYSHLRRLAQRLPAVERELAPNREVIRITISDTGPGIPEERIDSIFDPFFTTKGAGEGTGLGLAIVAGSVADLGGRIEASSSGKGATFTIWLPTLLSD